MIACSEENAVAAALEVLENGGNAIDAAATLAFALSVTTPQASSLGGGGFMLIYLAKTGETIALDYREKAPKLAHKNLFLDENGEFDRNKTRYSHLASGVPGTVAGISTALEKYGTIPLRDAVLPAIKLAENGFEISQSLYEALEKAKPRMQRSKASMKAFYKKYGRSYQIGETLVQPDLAWTLKQIAVNGPDAFYKGEIAQRIVKNMKSNVGLITMDDLENYAPVIRKPVKGNYRGYDILSMPPPSSGGVHVIQVLNILEAFPISKWGANSAKTIHVFAEALKLAFADRSKHLGDSDFVPVPISGLTSKVYANHLRSKVSLDVAKPSALILPGQPAIFESPNTNHFSIIDKEGNIVSNTYTLNFSFGSKITVPDTGILLNNQMDDFVAKQGVQNAYGLTGSYANSISPEKRMLSSMAPTIVMRNQIPILVTGSPGGSRIISAISQVISNVIDHKMNIAEATATPRFHHQWKPDVLYLERGFSPDTIKLLKNYGHDVQVTGTIGGTQSIMIEDQYLKGSSDPRKPLGATQGL
jgi:gamma-glutamyltranspeptidase/glutathione hydrolase